MIREADGRYYVSFVVERDEQPLPPVQREVGVDLGLDRLAVLSGGEIVDNPRHLRSAQRRLARAQRALCRKQRGSANRRKAVGRVSVLHRRVRQTRLDAHHKLALRLVRDNQAVHLEDLSVAGLARTKPARSVNDASWSTLVRLIGRRPPTTAGPSLRSAAGIRRRVCARPAGTTTGPSRSPSGRGPARGAAPSTTATSTPRATCSPKDEGSPPGWRRSQTPVELMSDREESRQSATK